MHKMRDKQLLFFVQKYSGIRQMGSLSNASQCRRATEICFDLDSITGLDQPGVIKPRVIKPGMIKPGLIKPGVIKPGLIKPGAIKPGVTKPGVIKPGVIPERDLNVKKIF